MSKLETEDIFAYIAFICIYSAILISPWLRIVDDGPMVIVIHIMLVLVSFAGVISSTLIKLYFVKSFRFNLFRFIALITWCTAPILNIIISGLFFINAVWVALDLTSLLGKNVESLENFVNGLFNKE